MYNKKIMFWTACLGMLLFGMVMLSLGTINTFLTSKFALDELTIGSLAALLPFGILIGSLIFGPVVDRYGYKYLLIISTLLIIIGIEGIAFTELFVVIQVSFFLIGFGGGAMNGATNALVSDISTESKGAKLSLLGVFFGVGAIGMPALIGFLSKYYSYESVVAGIGFGIFAPVIFFLVINFPEPKLKQGFPIKKSFGLIKDSTLLLIGFVLFFESAIEGITNNWTTTFLETENKFSSENALYALSFLVLSLTIGRLILGGLLKKVRSFIVLFCCLGFMFAGALVLIMGNTLTISILGLIFMGIGFAAGFPVILSYVGEIYADMSGTAFSLVFVIALIGNTIMNYLVGIIAQNYGIKYFLFLIIISVILMTALLSVVLKRLSSKIKI
jgi:FHS family glucose/mannose:H+ symporter-like MFS transporter